MSKNKHLSILCLSFSLLTIMLLLWTTNSITAKAKIVETLSEGDIKIGDTIERGGMILKVTKIKEGNTPGELSIIGVSKNIARVQSIYTSRIDIDNYNITVVENNAFAGCNNLVYFSTCGSITIKEGAFKNCKNLEMIKFSLQANGANLTIEKNAFLKCKNLDIIIIGVHGVNKNKISISKNAFKGCNNLTDLYTHRKVLSKCISKLKKAGAKKIHGHKYTPSMFCVV